MCDKLGISAWEVIEAASTKPFGFLPHYPGPGLGGDCIPVVPHFLAWRLREYGYSAQLIAGGARDQRATCRARGGQRSADALNEAGKPIRDSRLLLWAWPTRRTFTTSASRPGSRSCASSSCAAAGCATATRGSTSSSSTASSTAASTGPPSEVAEADCVVVLTPHRAVPADPALGAREADRRHPQRRAGGPARQVDLDVPPRAGAGRRLHRRPPGRARACRGSRGHARGQLVRHRALAARRTGARGARVETADIRRAEDLWPLFEGIRPERVYLLAAQASRPLSESDPDYTEETNLTGARRVAEAVAANGSQRARLRQLAARVRAEAQRRGRDRTALRPAGRPRAPLEDLRRAVPRAVRAQARLRPRAAAARDRLRAEPGRARAARSRRPWSTSSAGSPRRASR